MTKHVKRVSLTMAFVATALSLTGSTTARADSTSDPYSLDVTGFHLGMSSDDVKSLATSKIPDAVFDASKGTLSSGTYKTPPMIFGVRVMSKDAMYGNPADKDVFGFVFDARPPYKVLSISRHRVYSQDNAGQFGQTIDALIAKYGQPVSRKDMGSAGTQLYWSWNSGVNRKDEQNSWPCKFAISETGMAGSLSRGSFKGDRESVLDKCGVWMEARVLPLSSNPALLGQFFVDFGDVKAMRDDELFVLDSLKKSAEGNALREKDKAAGQKPDL